VDGRRCGHADSDEEVRRWLRDYCAEHVEDDPGAAHVQVRRLSRLSWLSGGKLVPREEFRDDEPGVVGD
jgi:hypothetical protein